MKQILLLLIGLSGLLSCRQGSNNSRKASMDSIVRSEEGQKDLRDTVGFLRGCEGWADGLFRGYLQGVNAAKDSLGPFNFYECYNCNPTCRIIFIQKTGLEAQPEDAGWSQFKTGCANKFAEFDCFAFVYPFLDPDRQKDVHALNIRFPVTLRAYERIKDDRWRFVKEMRLNKFDELSRFEFNIIYRLTN